MPANLATSDLHRKGRSKGRPLLGLVTMSEYADRRVEDERFMRLALREAEKAGSRGEVPIGAVLVRQGEVLSARGNERELRRDPTAHAEMLVLRDAAALLGGWRILDATMYVTVEPCPMCAGALLMARLEELVFGTPDARGGAAGSVVNLLDQPSFNHIVRARSGVLAEEAREVLQRFFAARR